MINKNVEKKIQIILIIIALSTLLKLPFEINLYEAHFWYYSNQAKVFFIIRNLLEILYLPAVFLIKMKCKKTGISLEIILTILNLIFYIYFNMIIYIIIFAFLLAAERIYVKNIEIQEKEKSAGKIIVKLLKITCIFLIICITAILKINYEPVMKVLGQPAAEDVLEELNSRGETELYVQYIDCKTYWGFLTVGENGKMYEDPSEGKLLALEKFPSEGISEKLKEGKNGAQAKIFIIRGKFLDEKIPKEDGIMQKFEVNDWGILTEHKKKTTFIFYPAISNAAYHYWEIPHDSDQQETEAQETETSHKKEEFNANNTRELKIKNNIKLSDDIIAEVNGTSVKLKDVDKDFLYGDSPEISVTASHCYRYSPIQSLNTDSFRVLNAYNLVFVYMILDHAEDYEINPDTYLNKVNAAKQIYESQDNVEALDDDEELFANHVKAKFVFEEMLEKDQALKNFNEYIEQHSLNPAEQEYLKAPIIIEYFNKWAADDKVLIDADKINSLN